MLSYAEHLGLLSELCVFILPSRHCNLWSFKTIDKFLRVYSFSTMTGYLFDIYLFNDCYGSFLVLADTEYTVKSHQGWWQEFSDGGEVEMYCYRGVNYGMNSAEKQNWYPP